VFSHPQIIENPPEIRDRQHGLGGAHRKGRRIRGVTLSVR
jgi:hypothetical protein